MSFFPYSFPKMLVAKAGFVGTPGKKSIDLTAGQVAILKPSYEQVDVSAAGVPASIGDLPYIRLAQGSFQPNDKLGDFHGGYKESVKTKVIDPRLVRKFYVSEPKAAKAQIVEYGSNDALKFEFETTYRLRVDIKGSPALRAMNRNLYHTATAYTGCKPAGVDVTVDPAVVFEKWAQEINAHPIIKKFIKARVKYQVVGAAPVAATFVKPAGWGAADNDDKRLFIEFQTAYVDTKFGNSSWRPDEFVEMEPLFVYASLEDALENVCLTQSLIQRETQAPQYAQGTGESYIRELILAKRYRGEDFQYDNRMKEVLQDTTFNEIDRTKGYVCYHILHTVARHGNPSSINDNDQYLIKIIVEARDADFEAFLETYLEKAGSTVRLEVM